MLRLSFFIGLMCSLYYSLAVLAADGQIYSVWYGTNRKPVSINNPSLGFSSEFSSTNTYGYAHVYIPNTHLFGETGNSYWEDLLGVDFSNDQLAIKNIHWYSTQDYFSKLARVVELEPAEDKQLLIFIHGYNTSFKEAVIRATQLGFDLKTPSAMVLYSWPSNGELLSYISDERAAEASALLFKEFLENILINVKACKVHIIAHSMGNRALIRALERITLENPNLKKLFGKLILAAPDLDVALFNQLAYSYVKLAEHTTLYVSPSDVAVSASEILHGADRVGVSPPVTIYSPIETVEVIDQGLKMLELGHGYFADVPELLWDISSILWQNKPAYLRTGLMTKYSPQNKRYWQLTHRFFIPELAGD